MMYQEAKAMEQQLLEWRRQIHRHPELGKRLPQTTDLVKRALDQLGIQWEEICPCGIVGVIGPAEGKRILLRADMDALPMDELTGLPFASECAGAMHSCGHDLHTTILLGAAKILKKHENELNGTVKLLFQSGEETFEGAKAAIEAGILDNPHVDAAFAMHAASIIPADTIIYGTSPMAAVYGFRINLTKPKSPSCQI